MQTDQRLHTEQPTISHPRFAAFYTWLSSRPALRRQEDPWRQELVGQARGNVLEIGVGGGQNFPFYHAEQVTRLEATEPDEAMSQVARSRLAAAPVPITLTQASVEALPFADEQFDSVVATLVFCSVTEPLRGLQEIRRVLKPGGELLLLEHVRSTGKPTVWIQDALVPATTRLMGNCHWNRDTRQTVVAAGFTTTDIEQKRGGLLPVLAIRAMRPSHDTEP
jgi:ubiquinone/menaquinone biosynthesis C-methylase UbiE